MTVPKYSCEELRVLLQRGVGVEEDDALLLELLVDLVVDHLGLVLRRDTGHQTGLLGLRDAQLVVGVLDVGRQVVPAGRLLLGRADEVLDVVEVDPVELGTPGRHRLALEELVALQPQVEHPLRLALQRRDVGDDLGGQTALRGRAGDVGVRPAPLVAPQRVQVLVLGLAGADEAGRRGRRIRKSLRSVHPAFGWGRWWVDLVRGGHARTVGGGWSGVGARRAGCASCRHRRRGRWWPVAGRGHPIRRENASVSASHSCGNRSATWATGQWCWQSCSPATEGRIEATYPSPVRASASTWAGGCRRSARRSSRSRVARLQSATATGGELSRPPRPPAVGQELQRLHGEVVVGGVEAVRPASVRAKTLAGTAASAGAVDPLLARRPGDRVPPARRGDDGWRPAVRPSRSASAAAVDGPCSRMERATRSRVDASVSRRVGGTGARGQSRPRHVGGGLGGFHNTSVLLFTRTHSRKASLSAIWVYSRSRVRVLPQRGSRPGCRPGRSVTGSSSCSYVHDRGSRSGRQRLN